MARKKRDKSVPPPAPLTAAVQRRLDAMFSAAERDQAADLLIHSCGRNLPFLEDATPAELDRFRIAALKMSEGDLKCLGKAVNLAQVDWRDLLVSVGFADDLRAHYRWQPAPNP